MSIHELKGSVLRNLSPTFLHFCIRPYLVSFFLVSINFSKNFGRVGCLSHSETRGAK